jgi:hypothetical protein
MMMCLYQRHEEAQTVVTAADHDETAALALALAEVKKGGATPPFPHMYSVPDV